MSASDTAMPDAAQDEKAIEEQELDEKFPDRPRNFGTTLPFKDLYLRLFDPLTENRKKPAGPAARRAHRQAGPDGPHKFTPVELRRHTIDQFISRWRDEVGNDIYPAFRLILPDKDRDRPMYGLKESTIAKLLVKVLRIDANSADGQSLIKFKLPGQGPTSGMAGDFAGRCYEVIRKRPYRAEPTDMTIGEVNEQLDQLSEGPKERHQQKVFELFYSRMNATDLMWLVRIILRQMKIGATERTVFDVWHPDAMTLYSVSSNLRRVCWELWDPEVRLGSEKNEVATMSCFQPQLAQFQAASFADTVAKLRPTAEDDEFWIEEKLDGERIQMHMITDPAHKGGKRFAFWSRKAKEYTSLYGNGFEDSTSALTRHLSGAFHEGVHSLIVDGEMITWDFEQDKMVPFGTLKTAAHAEQQRLASEPGSGTRPLYCIFDMLLLNDKVLTDYSLRDRRKALEAAIRPVHRRFQIHPRTIAHEASEIEPIFRRYIEEESEGLVLKNPRSSYSLNSRCDDWMKVKPDYVGFGETPDLIVIGGYYGSGRRGGTLSSFLCGLRVDAWHEAPSAHDAQQCWSFCKVGGGMAAADYQAIKHATSGKWREWNRKNPPTSIIGLADAPGKAQFAEIPDVWIMPSDSVVLEVQAASVSASDSFRAGFTLRFPRFKRLRSDKDWRSALNIAQFFQLKDSVEANQHEKAIEFRARRQKRARTSAKKELRLEGAAGSGGGDVDDDDVPADEDPALRDPTAVFAGLTLYVMSGGTAGGLRRSKPRLEAVAKAHGARIVQTAARRHDVVCVAERNVVHAAAVARAGRCDVLKPAWLLDCIQVARRARDRGEPAEFLLPPEPERHLLHATLDTLRQPPAVDRFGDSFARDVDGSELRELLMAVEGGWLEEGLRGMGREEVRELLRRRGVGV